MRRMFRTSAFAASCGVAALGLTGCSDGHHDHDRETVVVREQPRTVIVERDNHPDTIVVERERRPNTVIVERDRRPDTVVVERDRRPDTVIVERDRRPNTVVVERDRRPETVIVKRDRGPRSVVYVREAPPPRRVERRPRTNDRDVFWIEGFWRHDGKEYQWQAGRYERKRPNEEYVPSRWEQEGDRGWRYQEGSWKRRSGRG